MESEKPDLAHERAEGSASKEVKQELEEVQNVSSSTKSSAEEIGTELTRPAITRPPPPAAKPNDQPAAPESSSTTKKVTIPDTSNPETTSGQSDVKYSRQSLPELCIDQADTTGSPILVIVSEEDEAPKLQADKCIDEPESLPTTEELLRLDTSGLETTDQSKTKSCKRSHSKISTKLPDVTDSSTLAVESEKGAEPNVQEDTPSEPVVKISKITHSLEHPPPKTSLSDISRQGHLELTEKDQALSPTSASTTSESSLALESTSSEQTGLVIRSVSASPIAYHENPLVLDLEDSNEGVQNVKVDFSEEQVPSTIDSLDEQVQPTAGPSGQWWEYASLSKGPKRTQFDIRVPVESSHQRLDFEDPASKYSMYPLISHSGRMRQGEGNDITPDPPLLKSLQEKIKSTKTTLERWSASSHSSSPKTVISSRLSRLRRRANHEANKIIFAGITAEREAALGVIQKVQSLMKSSQDRPMRLLEYYKTLVQRLPTPVAGRKVEYIDQVLSKLEEEEEESE